MSSAWTEEKASLLLAVVAGIYGTLSVLLLCTIALVICVLCHGRRSRKLHPKGANDNDELETDSGHTRSSLEEKRYKEKFRLQDLTLHTIQEENQKEEEEEEGEREREKEGEELNSTQDGEQEEVFVSSGHWTTGGLILANEGCKVEDDELTTAVLVLEEMTTATTNTEMQKEENPQYTELNKETLDECYTVPHIIEEKRDQITDMAKLEMQHEQASQYTELNKKTLDAPAEHIYTVPPPKKETKDQFTEAQLQGLSTQHYYAVPSKEARVKPTEPEPLQKPEQTLGPLYTELRKETLEPSEQYTELEVSAKAKDVEVEYVISEKDELALHAQPSTSA